MANYTDMLFLDSFYHVYNRANGNENLFLKDENYDFFLEKFKQHIIPIADVYCYCLMPNHFHFLIRIKSEKELLDLTGIRNLSGLDKLLSQQFSNFFNSYSKAINKQEGRKGSLFMRPFKRKKIETVEYLRKIVHYIHFNPIEAELCKTPEDYKFSSYSNILTSSNFFLKTGDVISWFDDLDNFIYVHKHSPKQTGIDLTFL